jgi:hypothetical protein
MVKAPEIKMKAKHLIVGKKLFSSYSLRQTLGIQGGGTFALHCTALHCTAKHSTAQHSTAQHSTAQHSTAQHSMFLLEAKFTY